ncbi:MAG: hypothetical protein CMJ18_27000, partial [Phycisphaeraceae bacterium]|nr:hypothetical protein [Phycisphaeraceae bacterium]
ALSIAPDGEDKGRSVDIGRSTDSLELDAPELLAGRAEAEVARIVVHDGQRELAGRSNPSLLRSDGYLLFWGDLHGQSQYHNWNPQEQVGISCNTPEACHRYARDIAGLDFCAVTDTASITQDIWADSIDAAQRCNEPGRFVTFQGSEVGDDTNGHRNALFCGDESEPRVEITEYAATGNTVLDLQTPRMQKRYAGRDDVILVPHHTKMWADWACHAPALEPVQEIYSIWGSCEKAGTDQWEILREMTGGAQEAWARGYRIGVIAGSDTHTGMPGRSLAESDRDDFMIYKAGYAAVWAEQLTRQSIFDALKARRCYGTTGERIILETMLDGRPMGSEVPWSDPQRARSYQVRVWGTDVLDSITVVKNNIDVYVADATSDHAAFEWSDPEPAKDGDYCYVRVIQRDGNRAWSSPTWVWGVGSG